jgi:transcriptional regulator of acetoin/glycerol metabolism
MNHLQSRRAFGPFAGGIVRNMAAEAEAAAVAIAAATFVLERVLDQVHRVDMTPMAIVHAVKLYARITDDGELLDLHRPLPPARARNSAKLQKNRAAANAPKRRAAQSPRKRKSHISSRDTRVFSRDTRTSRNSPNSSAISELTNV